jgi:hypothetical protein
VIGRVVYPKTSRDSHLDGLTGLLPQFDALDRNSPNIAGDGTIRPIAAAMVLGHLTARAYEQPVKDGRTGGGDRRDSDTNGLNRRKSSACDPEYIEGDYDEPSRTNFLCCADHSE